MRLGSRRDQHGAQGNGEYRTGEIFEGPAGHKINTLNTTDLRFDDGLPVAKPVFIVARVSARYNALYGAPAGSFVS